MARGLQSQIRSARQQATAQDQYNFQKLADWRVKLSLAPGAKYLYNAPNPGILAPLASEGGTGGVVFPYMPVISVTYNATYDPTEVIHSNYKIFQYRSSAVDNISITGEFTAQDVNEANYLLAVIHFFKSVTKMFYGKDQYPVNGTPPPLCYLTGLGDYQFNNHPLAITNFTYTLPNNDVDYIRAYPNNPQPDPSKLSEPQLNELIRTMVSGIGPGGEPLDPNFTNDAGSENTYGSSSPTYVPTKMQIQLSASPIVTRNDVSSNFSLQDYANGKLLAGGIW